jgi:hypothetical protein
MTVAAMATAARDTALDALRFVAAAAVPAKGGVSVAMTLTAASEIQACVR